MLGMPALRDRVVHGALNRILAPIVAADFHDGSVGDRPQRTAPPAVDRVAAASVRHQPRGLAVDLAAAGDRGRPALRLAQVARRVNARAIRHVLQLIL